MIQKEKPKRLTQVDVEPETKKQKRKYVTKLSGVPARPLTKLSMSYVAAKPQTNLSLPKIQLPMFRKASSLMATKQSPTAQQFKPVCSIGPTKRKQVLGLAMPKMKLDIHSTKTDVIDLSMKTQCEENDAGITFILLIYFSWLNSYPKTKFLLL